MSDRKLNVTVYFTKEQIEQLDEMSKKARVPKAVIVREALDAFIIRYHKTGSVIRERRGEK